MSQQNSYRGKTLFLFSMWKYFPLEVNLLRHIATHTGEKQYFCTWCDKAFYQYKIDDHMKTHTGEKPFTCSSCDKSFSQSQHLNSQYRTHTGEKTFVCSICDKAFSQSNTRNRHTKNHTGENSKYDPALAQS